MNTYNMKNIEIVKTTIAGTTETFLVYADTERFGEHEIMAQFPSRDAAVKWLQINGVEIEQTTEEKVEQSIAEMIEEQLKSPSGRVQVANTMYRHIHRVGESIMGYSRSDGWIDLNRFFKEAVPTGKNRAITTSGMWYGWQKRMTIKFGNECTW